LFPILLKSLVDFPILLPQRRDLIIPTHPESVPEMMSQLAAWRISGNDTKTRKFHKRAQSCSLPLGGRGPPTHMTSSSGNGLSGIVNRVQILFQVL
jgi:hypothetical protein